jgi:hypothetical protein
LYFPLLTVSRIEDMSGDELTFLQSLEPGQGAGVQKPFVLGKGGGIVRLAFSRKLNKVTSFGSWVVISIQPHDFKNMVKALVTSVAVEDELQD